MSPCGKCMLLLNLLWISNFINSQEFKRPDNIPNPEQNLIHWKIQRERATEIIKNKILKELAINDANLPKSDYFDDEMGGFQQSVNLIAPGPIDTEQQQDLQPAREEQLQEQGQPEHEQLQETLIILGEETSSSKKDKCLVFNFKKANNTTPFRMPLYMYIRKVRTKKRTKKQERGAQPSDEDSEKNKNNKKRKNKRNRGRKIHVTISDGDSNINLVKTQRRIRKSDWYTFDLPISHFPSVFRANESYTLCFRCKRCSRKVKLELQRKRKRASGRTLIPFIHVDYRSQLPQSNYRQKRSSHVNSASHLRHHDSHMTSLQTVVTQSIPNCCAQSTFLQNITADISRVLYPESVNVTLCVTSTSHSSLYQDTADVMSLNTPYNKLSCEPHSFKDFKYVYLDRHLKVKQGIIKNLTPQSCHCLVSA